MFVKMIVHNFNNSIVLAIIAINMTVIGLTSLADSKNVVGIDYGDFLIKKYKVGNFVRMFILLVLFAGINIFSLITLIFKNELLLIIMNISLLLSLFFAIYYFFSYILIENDRVKKQIIERELMGIFIKDDNTNHFEVDELINIPPGNKTGKRLSSNFINYFNNDSEDTVKMFERCFGIESTIYSPSKYIFKNIKKKYGHPPYKYRVSSNYTCDISHEFFRLFRSTNLQHKWIIDILRVCNNYSADTNFDKLRLYNITRAITHINVFGYSQGLYKYKFLEVFKRDIDKVFTYKKVDIKTDLLAHIIEVETFFYSELFKFISSTTEKNENDYFVDTSIRVISDIIENKGILAIDKKVEVLVYEFSVNINETNRAIVNKIVTNLFSKDLISKNTIDKLKDLVLQIENGYSNKAGTINLYS